MLRVVFISQDYSTHSLRFLTSLAGAGNEVWFLPCEERGDPIESSLFPSSVKRLRALGKDEASFSATDYLETCESLREVLEEVKPDLVLAGPVHTGGLLAALGEFHPLIVMSWGYDVLTATANSRWRRSAMKFALSRADMALADCEAVCEAIRALAPIPRERILCFPWGIDLENFQLDAAPIGLRESLRWEGCKLIVSARSLEPLHGTMMLLEAMKQVLLLRAEARVVLLGDGSLRPRVEDFIERNGLRDRIHVVGRVPEEMLPGYFAEGDLYVSAAECDGSSISLLEAMGCGLVPIVPDVGGNREWVRHEKNGWIYTPGNADALADCAIRGLDADAVRQEMKMANVEIVRERADWRKNFSKLLEVCERLAVVHSNRSVPDYAELQNR